MNNPLEEDLEAINNNPQAHFLSPAHPYDFWEDDDEDDDDTGADFEWDAGIVDFSLFAADKERFESRNLPIPHKWDGFLADQQQVYQRSASREDNTAKPAFLTPSPSESDSVPGLTPDSSPNLHDNLDYPSSDEEERPVTPPRSSSAPINIPPRPKSILKKPTTHFWEDTIDETDEGDEEYLPLSYYVSRGQVQRKQKATPQQPPKLQRPGLRGTRTLSGKVHSWVRPSYGIESVEERKDEEIMAEIEGGEMLFEFLKGKGVL